MSCHTEMIFNLSIVFTVCFLGLGSALRMGASPNPFNQMIDQPLEVSCRLDQSSAASQDVVVIQIQRPNQQPIATIDGQHGLNIGAATTAKTQAEGTLDNKTGKTYLKLIIEQPAAEDTGIYECSIFFMDKTLQMKEDKATVNVTIDNQDTTAVTRFLLKKLSSLETKMDHLMTENKRLRADKEQRLSGLESLFDELMENNTIMHHSIGAFLHNQTLRVQQTVSLMNQLKASMTNPTGLGKVTCAFTAAYDSNTVVQAKKIIKFQDILTNLGKGYDGSSGIFTAPVRGVYVFHISVCTKGSLANDVINISMQHNLDPVARLYASDTLDDDQSSISFVRVLGSRDLVYPILDSIGGSDSPFSGYYSLFSGFLLQPL